MKKILGIAKENAEIPEWLDREITATAALRARSFRQRRRIKVMLSSAAAALLISVGFWSLQGYFKDPAPVREVASISQKDLLSMSDFSSLEQECVSLEQFVASYEPNGEYTI